MTNLNWRDELPARDWVENQRQFLVFMSEGSPVAFLVNQEMLRGKKFAAALDYVCGEGSFRAFAKSIYDSIRAKPNPTAFHPRPIC